MSTSRNFRWPGSCTTNTFSRIWFSPNRSYTAVYRHSLHSLGKTSLLFKGRLWLDAHRDDLIANKDPNCTLPSQMLPLNKLPQYWAISQQAYPQSLFVFFVFVFFPQAWHSFPWFIQWRYVPDVIRELPATAAGDGFSGRSVAGLWEEDWWLCGWTGTQGSKRMSCVTLMFSTENNKLCNMFLL